MSTEKVRQVRVPEGLWTRIVRSAARESLLSGKRVSVVGWVRGAIEQRLSRDEAVQPEVADGA